MRFLVKIAPHPLPNRNHFRIVCDSSHPDCFAHRPPRFLVGGASQKNTLRFLKRLVLGAQRARMRAARQQRKSPALWAARLDTAAVLRDILRRAEFPTAISR